MATTTPNYGWSVPTSSDYVAQGAVAIETLGDSVDATLFTALGGNYPGLRLVKKQTIGSAVSSVNVTSAFSGTYEAYKIVITGGVSSTDSNLTFKLGASATGYYEVLRYNVYSTGAAQTPANTNNGTFWQFIGNSTTNAIAFDMNLRNPGSAKWTFFDSIYLTQATTGNNSGVHQVATAYTDFTITPSAGTLTGGTIYVYGYGAS